MDVWFTSDHHFGHENIIKFCNRPFASADEMDAALIERWNEAIKPGDIVYHLGDFCLGYAEMAQRYFARLNGRIMVLGTVWHHDKRWIGTPMQGLYHPVDILPAVFVLESPPVVTLFHYPIAEWDRKHYGAWHLHGHSHGVYQAEGRILDVGVDCHDYRPINIDDVAKIMKEKVHDE